MPLPQNFNFNVILGAGVLGIVCAATLYVVEQIRQERKRHGMAKDLARLNTELAVLRKELDNLMAQQKQKVAKREKKNARDSFVTSSVASTAEYASALDLDSSDLEFYDVSDEEGEKTDLDSVTLSELAIEEVFYLFLK